MALAEIKVKAVIDNLGAVTGFVNAALEKMGCSGREQRQIDVAVDELFSNIAKYAYPAEEGMVLVRVEQEPHAAVLTFEDWGRPYDPLSAPDPDITLSAEEREIGGLGVFLVKQTMDDVHYAFEGNRNTLRIRKNLTDAPEPA